MEKKAWQHQLLSSNATGNIYPGNISSASNQSAGNHWQQRIACCNALNGSSTHQSHLLSRQQQPQHNQIQQSTQLRYFQLRSPSSSSSLGNQSHQHNFVQQRYTFLAAASSLASSSSSSSQISSRSSLQKCERFYGGYLSSDDQLSQKKGKSWEEISDNNAQSEKLHHLPQCSQSLSILSGCYNEPRWQIVSGGHFGLAVSGQQLTSGCWTLGSLRKAISGGIEATSRCFEGCLVPKIIPSYPEGSLLGFVNAFEAVPDMLEEVRPGVSRLTGKLSLPPLLFNGDEFSYHASKPQLTIRLESEVVTTRVSSICDKNWPQLSNNKASTSVQPIASVTERPEKVWKKLSEDKSFRANIRRSVKSSSSARLKTYAAAVQVTGREDTRSRSDRMSELMAARMKIQEARRVNHLLCPSSFHSSAPRRIETRQHKRGYDSCDEEYEFSSASTVSSSIDTISSTPERFSSAEAMMKNWKENSSASLREAEEMVEDDSAANAPSRKRLCTMAESFCFGQLENAAFFRAFDEYNRRRRRMSYTRKLEPEDMAARENFPPEATVERKPDVFGNHEYSPRFGNIVYTPVQRHASNSDGFNGTNVQNRLNGIQQQTDFKLLQKLKEYDDGTGAIYTNSWRPEEIHFLRRCYHKNI